ncbi:hypothetical protein [Paenibacillus lentus]|uniref:Uncharacterized protein n=1 Tax=Paenibacillus lentus TaxID=1338368 RepID=A0A3S8RQQ8_9BACL|nr:hypothetical protein [Paenibacillus lentus]AZK45177.1 hypothetical protein EIM92_02330 [Paenibacillus lentus]
MKKKTREIFINGRKYSYVINIKYIQHKSQITLRISVEGSRNNTCTYRFVTWDDAIAGCPLLVGVTIKIKETNEITKFNLHHPKQISRFILFALDNGWNGESTMEYHDGLEIMSRMGFDVEWLRPGRI